MIFDGHLDLALNAIEFRRDLTLPLEALRAAQTPDAVAAAGTPTVSFDALRRGGVTVAVSTLLARSKPWAASSPWDASAVRDWPAQHMAYAVAQGQLAWYRLMEARSGLRVITRAAQLHEPGPLGVILTMEGADPITDPQQLAAWHDAGLRTAMLAHFGRSHYAHGTPSEKPSTHDVDGPLTDRGVALLEAMHELRMPLDLTHLSDTSFFQAVETFPGRIYSSHSGCRAIHDRQRNHSDDMLRRIVERDGVVGLPLYNHFLEPADPHDTAARAALDRLVDHADHVCQIAGSAKHVALGTDLDGGFGREHIPRELDSIADLALVGDALERRGFSADDRSLILSGNWLRFFSECLP